MEEWKLGATCKVAASDFPATEDAPGWRTLADFERHMADWCSRTWDRVPAESEIRKRLSKLIQYRSKRG
jgi:hypothetical protein